MANNIGGSGVVRPDSELKRKMWVAEGLLERNSVAFWTPYKGTSFGSVINVQSDISKNAGHEVVFEWDGKLTGMAREGNEQAQGTGEKKVKFSDKIRVTDYRYPVDNGTKFDGVDIGDLSINEHISSRNALSDLWVRSEDQSYFDLGQQADSAFGIDLGADFTFEGYLDVEEAVKTGYGFDVTPSGIDTRIPLEPFRFNNGEELFLWVMDVKFKNMLFRNQASRDLLAQCDVRGNDNRILRGKLGKIGNFLIVEAPTFMGTTKKGSPIVDSRGYYKYNNNGVHTSGLRYYDKTNQAWSGEEGFDHASALQGTSLILGAGAFQKANGKMPDYSVASTDFAKFSESCLDVWCSAKATKLYAENWDYEDDGKVAGYNLGIIQAKIDL